MVNRFYADSSVKSARVSLFLSVYKSLLPVCDNDRDFGKNLHHLW